MWYIHVVRLDSSRVATLDKARSATLVSSDDPTRVKSNYIPVKTTILRQIELCPGVRDGGFSAVGLKGHLFMCQMGIASLYIC